MFAEDIDLLIRMAASHPFAYVPTATAIWHVDAGNRMCVQQAQDEKLYTPGSLGASVDKNVADPKIASQAKERAVGYMARRERAAILSTLLAGQRSHALYLYRWWQEYFHLRSILVEGLLKFPATVLRIVGKARAQLRRARIIMAYLLELPANFATFKGK